MTREENIKAGNPETIHFNGKTLTLYWEVWSEAKVKPCFIVELELGHGLVRVSKVAFETFEEADAAYQETLRKNAVEIAIKALGIKTDTIKIRRPPTI